MLLYQPHPTPRIRRAKVPVHVVRRARDDLSLAVPVVAAIRIIVAVTITIPIMVPILATSASFDREISPAAAIHPDAPAVRAPAVAFPAGRFATLLDEPNSALCIG